MLDISKSGHKGTVKVFKTEFKKATEEMLKMYADTEVEEIVKKNFGDDDNAAISEKLY